MGDIFLSTELNEMLWAVTNCPDFLFSQETQYPIVALGFEETINYTFLLLQIQTIWEKA